MKTFGNTILRVFEPLIETLLGEVSPMGNALGGAGISSGDLLFARFILLIIVFSLVWIALATLPMFSEKKTILWVVSIAVSLLSVRFILSPELIATIILPYSALGVALTAFLPLLVYFLFVQKALLSRVMRKAAWIFAAVVFFGLYFVRFEELGDYAWLYLISAVACLVILFLDKTIQTAFRRAKYENLQELRNGRSRVDIMRRIDRLEESLRRGYVEPDEYNKEKIVLQKLARRNDIPY